MVDVSKEIADKALEAIELARSTGKVKKGTNETTKALERGDAKLVVVAKDVTPPEIVMHIPLLAEEKEVICIHVDSREELGAAVGMEVSTSSVAITQEGEAKQLVKEINTSLKKKSPEKSE